MPIRSLVLVLAGVLAGCATTSPEKAKEPEATAPATPPPDPALEARKAYSNPGGMWLPRQMTLPAHQQAFTSMGVALSSQALSSPLEAPLNAVVSLGGCTGSFVSPDGLVVTNHHCVQGALNLNSTPGNNLVENGFLARTRADEKTAGPTARVLVMTAYRDVTREMTEGLSAITDPVARKRESEKRLKALIAACEKDRPGLRCTLPGFFGGAEYQLIESLEIRDVRLVYVPPRSIGNYGGEIDNWAWPRHVGDFSFYRAYVGKDGQPADYSPDNVPYTPKHHLKVSQTPLSAHDFVMIVGYPGSTARIATHAATTHLVEWALPYRIAYYKDRYALLEGIIKDNAGTGTAIKAGVAKQGVQNALENWEGKVKGLGQGELMERKKGLDQQVRDWAARPGNEEAARHIARLDAVMAETASQARAEYDFTQAVTSSALLRSGLLFARMAEERTRPDAERKPGYQERDMRRLEGSQRTLSRTYDAIIDRAMFRLALERALALPEADRAWLPGLLGARKGQRIDAAFIATTLDGWYKNTKLDDEKLRLELLTKGTAASLKASRDPFVKAALAVWPAVKALEAREDAREGELLVAAPSYAVGMREVLGGALSPDANSTLRITYGTVKPFAPGQVPFTVVSDIPRKDTGKDPFDAPKKLMDLVAARTFGPWVDERLGEVPVNFLSDLDITGGNSGSPTLNHKGELVGLAFDGTIEGVASDVVFNGATTRTISCDARYMAWVMDAVDGADGVLQELGLTPAIGGEPAPAPAGSR